MARKKNKDLKAIGKVIKDSFDQGFLGLAKEMVKVFEVWPEAVGEYAAQRSRPDSIKDGCLTVVVESAVWIDRFTYLKEDFVARINEQAGDALVEEITFKIGRLSNPPAKPKISAPEVEPELPDPHKAEKIDAALAGVKDEGLKKSLAALFSKQKPSR